MNINADAAPNTAELLGCVDDITFIFKINLLNDGFP